jgi:hypothetical protein
MTKSPSTQRTSDNTKWRLSRYKMKEKNIYKLLHEIAEHERQLKLHPMGSIILKAQIKEKRAKLLQLDPERRYGNRNIKPNLTSNSTRSLRGVSVSGLGNLGGEESLSKAIYEDKKLKSKKHTHVNGESIK